MRRSIVIRLRLNNCQNPQFGRAVLLISVPEIVGCILPSRLSQFVELHLLLPKPLHALLYRVSDCAHHSAGFVIFAQLVLLCLFIILIFPIFPMVGTCKITQTVSDSNQHLLKRLFGLLDANPASSACIISSCSFWTAASVSSTRFLAPAVSLSTKSSIHISFSSLLKKCVSCRFSAASFFLDLKLCNAPRARTLSAAKPLLPLFAWWCHWVDRIVDFPFLPAGSVRGTPLAAVMIHEWIVCKYMWLFV